MRYLLKITPPLYVIFFTLFTLFSPLQAEDPNPLPHKKICLNMIVKNEEAVITRCLTSVLPLIDYWVIVDTGSTDGTQTIIKDFMKMKGVPGELHERPWVDFAHNRNEALQLAQDKGDYLFFIDADEYLTYAPDFSHPYLDKDYYYVTTKSIGMNYGRLLCMRTGLDVKWEGVLHESLMPSPTATWGTLTKIYNITTPEGARSKDPEKLQKDVLILEAAVQKEPNNSRYVFYLAQTYFSMCNFKLALETYEKRLLMEGFDQEIFWSKLRIAQLQELLDMTQETVVASYKSAYEYRSLRMEPLYFLALYYRRIGEYAKSYDVAKIGLSLPPSKDILFVEQWIFDYGLLLEFSACAYWIGRYEESQKASIALLKKIDLPLDIRDCVEKNLGYANAKLLAQVGTKKTDAAMLTAVSPN